MNYAICPISVVPVRSSAADKSEQTTQLLFGDLVEILERKGKMWSKVRCEWDNAIGWVASNQLLAITPSEFELFQEHYAFNLELLHPVMSDAYSLPVPFGAKLPNFDGLHFQLAEKSFTFSGLAVLPSDIQPSALLATKIARRLLYAPFQAGGRSPLGIDAAGFTQTIFGILGIRLHREPGTQVHQGDPVDFVEQAEPGDLAFFENRKGKVTHVGMLLGDQQIIHAHGHVRIDRLDHFGIYNEELQSYTHKLRLVRRILPPEPMQPEGEKAVKSKQLAQQFELF